MGVAVSFGGCKATWRVGSVIPTDGDQRWRLVEEKKLTSNIPFIVQTSFVTAHLCPVTCCSHTAVGSVDGQQHCGETRELQ